MVSVLVLFSCFSVRVDEEEEGRTIVNVWFQSQIKSYV